MVKNFRNGIMGAFLILMSAWTTPTTVQAAAEIRIVAQEAEANAVGLSGLYLEVGGVQDLKFLGAPSGWRNLQPTWLSADTKIATVDSNGIVTGVTEGTTTIIFCLNNQMSGSITVTVGNPITLGTEQQKSITEKKLNIGEKFDFNFYGMKGWNRSACQCIWSSSTDAVIVDDMGMVTALKEGTAEITLAIQNTKTNVLYHTASSKIIVSKENTEFILEETEQKEEETEKKQTDITEVPDELSTEKIYASMISLQEEYPDGMRWTNDNYYGWNGGIYSGGYGCAGFAFLLSDAAFGDLPARIATEYDSTETTDLSEIRVGDILRMNRDTHSVIVLEITEDGVIVAEGNYNSSIHWGRKITWKSLENSLTYVMTRYPKE